MAKKAGTDGTATATTATAKKRSRRQISFRLEYRNEGESQVKPALFDDKGIVLDSVRDAKMVRDILKDNGDFKNVEKWYVTKIIETPNQETELDD